MKVAHVIPYPWTGLYSQGKYRMALAHWALKSDAYVRQIRSKDAYILLDNGAFEGVQLSTDELNKAIGLVGSDEIVLPDAPGDAKETLRRSWQALGRIAADRVMFVPHGKTYDEWRGCLRAWMTRWEASDWKGNYHLSIGVGCLRKSSGTRQTGTRLSLLTSAVVAGYPIHLLGIGSVKDFVLGELPEARSLTVRGVDTSLAFALAAKRVLLTPEASKVHLGDPSEYKTLSTWPRRLVHLNVAILDYWVSTGDTSKGIPTRLIRETAQRWLKYWQEGFVPLAEVMAGCGVRPGRYALLKENRREKYIRPLTHFKKPLKSEELVEVKETHK